MRIRERSVMVAIVVTAVALLTAACGEVDGNTDVDDDSAAGEEADDDSAADADTNELGPEEDPESGVAFGATMEEYQNALADMDPVTLRVQVATGPDAGEAQRHREYYEAVEEWSGGSLQFDIVYALSVAPIDEIVPALNDGRLGASAFVPQYDPDRFPAINAMVDLSFIGSSSPHIGQMQALAWQMEAVLESPEIADEMDAAGIHLLNPVQGYGSYGLFCAEPLTSQEDLEGKTSRASGRTDARQLEALGMTPVSMTFGEVFEALERGVLDCINMSMQAGDFIGFWPAAPHFMIPSQSGFSSAPVSVAMSQQSWDELPLTAQQLMFDRMDVFLEEGLHEAAFAPAVRGVEAITEAGGGVEELGTGVEQTLAEFNDALLQEFRESTTLEDPAGFVDSAVGSSEKWYSILTEDLGYQEWDYIEFANNYERSELDVSPFIDRLFEEVMLPHRPS